MYILYRIYFRRCCCVCVSVFRHSQDQMVASLLILGPLSSTCSSPTPCQSLPGTADSGLTHRNPHWVFQWGSKAIAPCLIPAHARPLRDLPDHFLLLNIILSGFSPSPKEFAYRLLPRTAVGTFLATAFGKPVGRFKSVSSSRPCAVVPMCSPTFRQSRAAAAALSFGDRCTRRCCLGCAAPSAAAPAATLVV